MSIKGTAYLELVERLKTELQFDQVITEDNPSPLPNVKWIDKDKSQFENLDNEYPIPFPAILIAFMRGNYSSLSDKAQSGEIIIRIRVGYENYADSFDGSSNQDDALKYFEFMEQVHMALQGFAGTNFTALQRVAEEEDLDHDMLIIQTFEYTTTLLDDSASNKRKYQIVDPNVTITKNLSVPSIEQDDGFVL